MAFRHVPQHLREAVQVYRRWPPLRGHFKATWRLPFRPQCMVVSDADEVLATDIENHCVQVFTLGGTRVRQWGSRGHAAGQFCYPSGIAVTKEGEVVVADTLNHRVQVFRIDGTFVRMWGSMGLDEPNKFFSPSGVAITKTGEVMVIDKRDRVQVFRLSDGAFLRQFGTKGQLAGQVQHPAAVCVTQGGEVRVSLVRFLQVGFRFSSQTLATGACKCSVPVERSCASGTQALTMVLRGMCWCAGMRCWWLIPETTWCNCFCLMAPPSVDGVCMTSKATPTPTTTTSVWR